MASLKGDVVLVEVLDFLTTLDLVDGYPVSETFEYLSLRSVGKQDNIVSPRFHGCLVRTVMRRSGFFLGVGGFAGCGNPAFPLIPPATAV